MVTMLDDGYDKGPAQWILPAKTREEKQRRTEKHQQTNKTKQKAPDKKHQTKNTTRHKTSLCMQVRARYLRVWTFIGSDDD